MLALNDKYEIRISRAPHYDINSVDNKYYDMCINVCKEDTRSGHHSSYQLEITAYETGEIFSVIVLCSYCTKIYDNSGILMEDIFYVLLANQILEINLKNYSYSIFELVNPFGTYYEMYKCIKGFLVYGELEVLLLDHQFNECWRYATNDILFGAEPLCIQDDYITFTDYEGNYHEVNMDGRQHKYVKREKKFINIDMMGVKNPKEFQAILQQALGMPDFCGMNWNAYWDGITGLISLPDELILEGWHIYKEIQKKDAEMFELIMKRYNKLENKHYCDCIYKNWKK